MGKDNTVVQEEKTSLKMCIFVPSTVMSSWEYVAVVSCSCLTDAIPQRIIGQARYYRSLLLYKAGCHIYVPEILPWTWTHTVIVVHRLHLCSWSHYYMINIHHCRCAWTHILFSSSRAWSHLRCKPMKLLPASQYMFINGVRAWTYMEQWSSSTTSHHCSHSAWLSSLNNQVIVVRWLMIYLDLHFIVHDYHSLVAKYRHLCSWSHTVHGHILFGHNCWTRCHEDTPCV